MKRVALVGNMNNNFFAITRYLRDVGYDAHLFYRLAMEHFQPSADTFKEDYVNYCHQVHWLDHGFHNVDVTEVKEALKGFDIYIGQGEEAAAAYLAGFNINVYYPYGSDVYKYSYLPQEFKLLSKIKSLIVANDTRPTYKQMQRGTMAKYLRGAIANAGHILAETTNEKFEEKLNGLQYKGIYENVPMPFIYVPEYDELRDSDITFPAKKIIDGIRATHDFILLYHGRQEWKTYHNDFTGKNTHYLVQGFADYVKNNAASKSCLVMLEYGSDVIYTKELVKELGIEQKVFWLPKMYRKEIMYVIKQVDVCSGEFGYSYLTFGTIVEAMLMKKPVITYRDDSLYTAHYQTLYPCFNAREPNEIAAAITEAAQNPHETKAMGMAASEWIRKHFIANPLQHLINIIEQ